MNISIEFTQEEVVYLKNEIYGSLLESMKVSDKISNRLEKDRSNKEIWKLQEEADEKMNFLHILYEKFELY